MHHTSVTAASQLLSASPAARLHVQFLSCGLALFSYPDPPPKRKGGSGEYSTSSHHGLAVAMDSAKS